MPPQATKDWLALLEKHARNRNIPCETDLDIKYFHFRLGRDPGVVGKVRISEGKRRNYEKEKGNEYIWHRYNRENEAIEDGRTRNIVNITLDVWDKDEYDPTENHFIFLTEQLLLNETYSQGDQRIEVESDGQYSGPLAKYTDDWDALFNYAMNRQTTAQSGTQPKYNEDIDMSGSVTESKNTEIIVSEQFKQGVYDRFDHRCPLSGIENSALLTISHVLSRSKHPDLAEDPQNVLLLDWTHHMAFDAELWTFDESGYVWVEPDFDTESDTLSNSLIDNHGEKLSKLSVVSDEYIDRHNADLGWWTR
jgi:hypothetical protein